MYQGAPCISHELDMALLQHFISLDLRHNETASLYKEGKVDFT